MRTRSNDKQGMRLAAAALRFSWWAVLSSTAALAQPVAEPPPAAPQNPLDVVPEKMAFNTPYGAPIPLAKAEEVLAAAEAESRRRGWPLNCAVVDPGTHLVAFKRMDGALLAGVSVSEKKARSAVLYRRPTKVFQNAAGAQSPAMSVFLTLDGVVASAGGIPLIEDGKIIGAVGCSGGAGSQDEVVATAAARVVNK